MTGNRRCLLLHAELLGVFSSRQCFVYGRSYMRTQSSYLRVSETAMLIYCEALRLTFSPFQRVGSGVTVRSLRRLSGQKQYFSGASSMFCLLWCVDSGVVVGVCSDRRMAPGWSWACWVTLGLCRPCEGQILLLPYSRLGSQTMAYRVLPAGRWGRVTGIRTLSPKAQLVAWPAIWSAA